jgi:hypothetical protein
MAGALAAALIAVPAQAKKPDHAGAPDDRPAASKRCKTQNVAWNVRGEVVESTLVTDEDGRVSGDVVVTVTGTNASARSERAGDQPKTYSLTAVRTSFDDLEDSNADGVVDSGDVAAGSAVKLLGSVARPKRRCPAPESATATIRKAIFATPQAEEEPEA